MKIQKRTIYVLIGIVALAGLSIVFWSKSLEQQTGDGSSSILSSGAEFISDWKARKAKEDLVHSAGKLNDQEMAFYGRVIDQNENPVVGAKVIGGAQYNTMVATGVRSYTAHSDAAGNFVFPSIKGKDFECVVSLKGYQYLPAKDHNGYVLSKLAPVSERFVSNPEKPEIFRMWKFQGPEVLLCRGRHLDIPSDGTPLYINMKTGERSKDGGDVAFFAIYPVIPVKAPREERSVDWKFGIKVAGGGVIATDSTLPYLAPAEGYEEEWIFHKKKEDEYPRIDSQTFYIKTAEGNFGVFNIMVIYDALDPTCSMDIAWKLNPSGSRNLEPGKEQMLRKNSYMKPGVSLEYMRFRDQ